MKSLEQEEAKLRKLRAEEARILNRLVKLEEKYDKAKERTMKQANKVGKILYIRLRGMERTKEFSKVYKGE